MSTNRRTGMVTPGFRPGQASNPVRTATGATHRTGLPVRKYTYGGSGHDTLTPHLDEPPAPHPATATIAAPSGEVLPVVDVRLVLCPLCAADLCGFGCFEGPCKCACQDWRTP